jgi:outer membrane protein assembly factor BamB
MKLDAETGDTIWLNRVQPPEQFCFCTEDPAIDCGTDAMCNGAGPCRTKGAYHDFGFLNGPHVIEVRVQPGSNQRRTLVISGSKDGTLYALDEEDGDIVWTNEIVPTPVSPGFAGFGLFNGALAFEQGRLYAALNEVIPATNPAPPHLMSFDPRDGRIVWSTDIPPAWASVGVKQGVLFTGNNDVAEMYVHDAGTGQRLNTLSLPATAASRPAIVGDRVYVAYGIISGVGGIRAYGLP